LKSDVGDRIVEKSMKENRKKSYAGIKGEFLASLIQQLTDNPNRCLSALP